MINQSTDFSTPLRTYIYTHLPSPLVGHSYPPPPPSRSSPGLKSEPEPLHFSLRVSPLLSTASALALTYSAGSLQPKPKPKKCQDRARGAEIAAAAAGDAGPCQGTRHTVPYTVVNCQQSAFAATSVCICVCDGDGDGDSRGDFESYHTHSCSCSVERSSKLGDREVGRAGEFECRVRVPGACLELKVEVGRESK